jgi:ribose-phosphate pyrophosphokinase
MPMPVCIAVHAIFAAESYQTFFDLGVKTIITCNTIPHVSNDIDISQVIVDCLKEVVGH